MLESTIQRAFPSQAWFEAECDQCCTHQSVVLIEDERVCYFCLLGKYDEEGNKVVLDSDLVFGDWQPKHVAATILLFAPVAILFMLAMLLSQEEVAAFMRRLI